MDDAQRAQILAGSGYVTGALGALAPRLISKAFGLRDDSGEFTAAVRMMSLRNVALGAAMTMVADDDERRKKFFTIAAAMFAADTVTALVSAVTGKVSARTALTLGTTTAVLGGIAAAGAAGTSG